jgi:hypothetical protein
MMRRSFMTVSVKEDGTVEGNLVLKIGAKMKERKTKE